MKKIIWDEESWKNKILFGTTNWTLEEWNSSAETTYTMKVLKIFFMDQTHSLNSQMVVRLLDVNSDLFCPLEDDQKVFGLEAPYLTAIEALMYLARHIWPYISFSVNLLAIFNSCPTHRHWNENKHILRYLQSTKNIGLFFPNPSKEDLIGFAKPEYLSDPHNDKL